jgi:hypothetical protein
MRGDAITEEGLTPAVGSVDELVDHHELTWSVFLTQRTYRRNRQQMLYP